MGAIDSAATPPCPPPHPADIDRAIRLTYTQMMLNAVFAASTGGMFLIGFALELGASDLLLGMLSSIPLFFVLFQLPAAWLIERGARPKRMTVWFSFISPLCWLLIAAIPFGAAQLAPSGRLAVLIGVLTLVTLSAQFSGNARAVWLGDLIPAERRGKFFGACAVFSGVVGALFAVLEGRFLDFIRTHGLMAFTALFLFGALFGLLSAGLNLPQVAGPRAAPAVKPGLRTLFQTAVQNRPFLVLAAVHAVMALGTISSPFTNAYCLRDLQMSFFGVGCLNAISTVAALACAPLWGKAVDHYGGRPVLHFSLWVLAPCGLIWLGIPPGRPDLAYRLLPWTNLIAGFAVSALNVALVTLMYKMTPSQGRSFQFALYNILVTLVAAPMPLLGGWLVSRLQAGGWNVDLRLTFYLWTLFTFLAALCARRIREPDSASTQRIVFEYLPGRLALAPGLIWSSILWGLAVCRIRPPELKVPPTPAPHPGKSCDSPVDPPDIHTTETPAAAPKTAPPARPHTSEPPPPNAIRSDENDR